eukprot:2980178-Amphidinium_carterae.1
MWLPHLLQHQDIQVIDKGKHKPDTSAKLVIIGYSLLALHESFQLRADGENYGVVVIDEAHYIKSSSAKRTEVVLSMAAKARRCIMISGSPAVNQAEDMYTILQALLPKHLPSKRQYCDRYCQRKSVRIRGRWVSKYDGARNKAELYTLLSSSIMIRRLKKDVLTQLPAKRRQRVVLLAEKLDMEIMAELRETLYDWQSNLDDASAEKHQPNADIMRCFKLTAEAK